MVVGPRAALPGLAGPGRRALAQQRHAPRR